MIEKKPTFKDSPAKFYCLLLGPFSATPSHKYAYHELLVHTYLIFNPLKDGIKQKNPKVKLPLTRRQK